MLNLFYRTRSCAPVVALKTHAFAKYSRELPIFDWARPRPELNLVGLIVGEPSNCKELSSLARHSETSGKRRHNSRHSRSSDETARSLARPHSPNDWRRGARGPRQPAVEAAARTEEDNSAPIVSRRRVQDGGSHHARHSNRASTRMQPRGPDAQIQDEKVLLEIDRWLSQGGVSECVTQLNRRPDLQTADVMALVLRASLPMEQKVLIWRHMLTFGIQPSRRILHHMLAWQSMNSKSGYLKLITQPLKPGHSLSATGYSCLVKACAWNGKADAAQQFLEEAVEKGVNIGSDRYLAFLHAAVHTKINRGNLAVLLARWKQVSTTGLPDHLVDYKAAVHTLCILHLTDLAQALVVQLPHMGFRVDVDMYRVLIKGCVLAGMPEDAQRILRGMEEEGYQAIAVLWELVLQGFADCGSIQQFKAVLQEMAKRNLPRTGRSYVLELRAHLHNFDAAGVLAVKDQVEAAGEELSYSACPDLVHAYSMIGDMAAAHQILDRLPINHNHALHVQRLTFTALLEWHARRGEFYEALELYSRPGRSSPWAVYALAEAAMQHWHQMQGAKETPLAACLIRGGLHPELPCSQQSPHDVHSAVEDMRLLHVAPSKRWSLGPNNTAILDVQGNNAHLIYYGHWMTQLCFLEALQSLMTQNKSSRPHMILGAREIQVTPGSYQGRYGMHYKMPELLMTLLTLMQNLGISAFVHNGRVICKPQEIMRVVGEAEGRGQSFDAATFRGCLVGLEPL